MIEKTAYFIRQGLKNIAGHKLMSVISVCMVTASLVLLGIMAAEGVNVNEFMSKLSDSREINVYIARDAAGRSLEDIEHEIESIEGIESIKFYSREDRLKKVAEEVYGEDGYVYAGDENPLRDSYILTVADLTAADRICEWLTKVEGVEEIVRSSDIIGGIDAFTSGMRNIDVWTMLLFFIIAVFIIFSTVRLGMMARGDEIEIMKSVGATNVFITAPFMVEAFLLSLLGVALACIFVLCGYSIIIGRTSMLIPENIISFVSTVRLARFIIPGFLVAGTTIGVAGSLLAVRKYLK